MDPKNQFFLVAFFFLLSSRAYQGWGQKIQKSSISEMHEQWMSQHGRVYDNAGQKVKRFKIFKKNVEFIESFNNAGNKPYNLRVNAFADQTNEEFRAYRNGYRPTLKIKASKETSFRYENTTNVPGAVDWRVKGAVTPVKDQGECGCCWAFSAVAAMEGMTKISNGKLLALSVQELVDCDVHGEDEGCEGGLIDTAFQFIKQNGGLTTESNYPYMGFGGVCNGQLLPAAGIKGYEDVPSNNEEALRKAVANQPVSVAIDASDLSFQFYSSGVYTGDCGSDLNHAVVAVGYGTDDDGTKYWLVKNSWGTQWGEKGYVRMQRDANATEGLCGIAIDATYPIA